MDKKEGRLIIKMGCILNLKGRINVRKTFTLLVTLLLCMVLIAPAWGAQALSAQKQILIEKFSVDALDLQTQLSQTATGSADYTVNQLNGSLLTMVPELANIQGSKLSVDYKLNTPAEKIGFEWNLIYKGKDYHGDIFIAGSKIIFTKDILQLIKDVAPAAEIPDPTGLPQYLYLDEPEMSDLWATTMLNSRYQKVIPQLNGLFAFIIEAIPDKYIQLSGNNIQLQLSQKEFEEVINSVLKKVAEEPDRFATLVAELITTVDPSQTEEVQKDEILADLQQAIEDGKFPPKASEMGQFFREAGIHLDSLLLVTPKGLNGGTSLTVKLTVKNQEKSLGKFTFNMDQTRQGEQVNGKLDALLNLNLEEQKTNFVIGVSGDYGQSQNSTSSDMRINVTAASQQIPMLDLVLNTSSKATVDSQVKVDIPTLNMENSLDLNTIIKEEESKIQ